MEYGAGRSRDDQFDGSVKKRVEILATTIIAGQQMIDKY
jgi:hypothetical protein